jgi:hypothetical protein
MDELKPGDRLVGAGVVADDWKKAYLAHVVVKGVHPESNVCRVTVTSDLGMSWPEAWTLSSVQAAIRQGLYKLVPLPPVLEGHRYALLSPQGTACPETVLDWREYQDPSNRLHTEKNYCKDGDRDAPVAGTWTDVTDNEACGPDRETVNLGQEADRLEAEFRAPTDTDKELVDFLVMSLNDIAAACSDLDPNACDKIYRIASEALRQAPPVGSSSLGTPDVPPPTPTPHTPGPWRAEEPDENGHVLVVDVQEVSVARCYQQPYDTWLAADNAALVRPPPISSPPPRMRSTPSRASACSPWASSRTTSSNRRVAGCATRS